MLGGFQEETRTFAVARRRRHALFRRTRRLRRPKQHYGADAPELLGDGQRNVWIVTALDDGDAHRSIKKSELLRNESLMP